MSAGRRLFKELEPNFRDDLGSPPSLGNAPVGHAPAPSTVRQARAFSTSEADNRNGVTRGESAALANLANNTGDAHAKYEHASLLFEKPSLIDRRRPLSVASIPASPAGDNRQVVRQPGETGNIFDEHGLKLVLGSTANRVLSDDEARDFASFLGRIAS